jgi:hypothetical protein
MANLLLLLSVEGWGVLLRTHLLRSNSHYKFLHLPLCSRGSLGLLLSLGFL